LRSALPLSPLGFAAYMSEASLKKGVGRLKELGTFFLRFAMKAPLRVERNFELGTLNLELGTLNLEYCNK